MTIITYEIDPGGDIELVLECPNKQQIVPIVTFEEKENFRVPMFDGDSDDFFDNPALSGRYAVFNPEEEEEEEDAMDADGGGEDDTMEADTLETSTSNSISDGLTEVRIRVSSRHLILASRTFRTMLEGPWKENLSQAPGSQSVPLQIKTTDWDAAALVIVLDVIHGRYQGIPKTIDIGLLTRIATVVDYYECHESLQLISDIWMANLLHEVPGLANIDFKDLPAHQVLAEIDTARQELIGRYMTGLNALRKTLSEETGCPTNGNPNCSAIILGVLIREQHKLGLLDPSPVAPYSGYNIFTLVSRARQFPNPRPQERYCSCNIQKRLNPILEGIEYSISKYNLTA